MNLYHEMKGILLGTYSDTSRHLDDRFKYNSIKGYIKNREAYYKAKRKPKPVKVNPIDQLLSQLYEKKLDESSFETSLPRKKNVTEVFNIDNEISDIFKIKEEKKKEPVIKKYKIYQSETRERVARIRMLKPTDRPYYPNYNSIDPHIPSVHLGSSKKALIKQKVLNKDFSEKNRKHSLKTERNNKSINGLYSSNNSSVVRGKTLSNSIVTSLNSSIEKGESIKNNLPFTNEKKMKLNSKLLRKKLLSPKMKVSKKKLKISS